MKPCRVACITATLLILAVLGGAGSVACGGSPAPPPSSSASQSPSPVPSQTASGSPTPVPSPQITSGRPPAGAVAVVRRFWELLGRGALKEAQERLTSPQSTIRDWDRTDIAAARFVRVVPHSVGKTPVEGATMEFAVDVWIKPSGPANAWGPTGAHQLFENVVRMSDGSWRLVESGTGP